MRPYRFTKTSTMGTLRSLIVIFFAFFALLPLSANACHTNTSPVFHHYDGHSCQERTMSDHDDSATDHLRTASIQHGCNEQHISESSGGQQWITLRPIEVAIYTKITPKEPPDPPWRLARSRPFSSNNDYLPYFAPTRDA